MKKKLISFILLGVCSFSLVSCGEQPTDNVNRGTNANTENRFIDTGDTYVITGTKYKVVYDSITNIVYMRHAGGYTESITTMYNKNGQPMTLDEYNSTK